MTHGGYFLNLYLQHSAALQHSTVNGCGLQGAPFAKQSSFGPIGGGVPVAAPSGPVQQYQTYGGSPFVPAAAPGPISPLSVTASAPGPIGGPSHPPPHPQQLAAHDIGLNHHELGGMRGTPPLQFRDQGQQLVFFFAYSYILKHPLLTDFLLLLCL